MHEWVIKRVMVVLLCSHSSSSGSCKCTILSLCRLPRRDFVAGSSADVQIALRNDSSVDVRSVSVRVRRGEGGRECECEWVKERGAVCWCEDGERGGVLV